MDDHKRLVIIDGKSVFYRGYYAMPNLSTRDGHPTGAIYGFAAIAMTLVQQLRPTKVVVAWDSKTSANARREIYPDYKKGRVKPGADFYAQIPRLEKLVHALGWGFMECDRYEADDIIGTLSQQADNEFNAAGQCVWDTYIISSDLDMLQIVDENTRMYRILHGFSELEELDVPAVEAKYHIKKSQFLDFKALKGGHTGALDPQASGLLPICLGEAAKFSSFFLEGKKRYLAEGTLGKTTTTCDREGEVVIERDIGNAMERLEEVLGQFVGTIVQVPPIYSAVKVNGKPLYKYARQGREVEIPERTVEIYELKLLETSATTFKVEVFCSKGTYIRTLISDIGEALGCGAYVSHLRRVYVENLLIPIEAALGNLPVVELPQVLAEPLSHGMKVRLSNAKTEAERAELKLPEPFPELNALVQAHYHGLFLGVCYFADPNLLVPKRMMDPDIMAQRLAAERA